MSHFGLHPIPGPIFMRISSFISPSRIPGVEQEILSNYAAITPPQAKKADKA